MSPDDRSSVTLGTNLEVHHSPKLSVAYASVPELSGLDPSDPYRSVIECSYTGNLETLDGRLFTKEKAPKPRNRPDFYASHKADRRIYNGKTFRRAGTGRSYSTCGLTVFTAACSDPACSSPPQPMPRTCGRYDCPECYHSAIRRMATRSSDRINSYPDEFREETGLGAGRQKHMVIALDPKKWTRERCISDAGKAMMKHVDAALRYAAKDGFYAFEAIIHLQRRQHKDGTCCERDNCELPADQHIWVWGPHVHAVGYGHFMATAELHNAKHEKGRQIGRPMFDDVNLIQVKEAEGQDRDAYATLYYLGTHASIFYHAEGDKAGKQASKLIKHLGFVSPSIYRQTREGSHCSVKSCDCGQPIKVYAAKADKSPDRSIDYGPQLDRRPIYSYRFNHRKLAAWMRDRDRLGRLWIARRARAMLDGCRRHRQIPYPEGDRAGGRSTDGGIPHGRSDDATV